MQTPPLRFPENRPKGGGLAMISPDISCQNERASLCVFDEGGGTPPQIFIFDTTIQGSLHIQIEPENENIKSDFKFAHIWHIFRNMGQISSILA